MSSEIVLRSKGAVSDNSTKLLALLKDIRNIKCTVKNDESAPELPQSLLKQLESLSQILKSSNYSKESEALLSVYSLCFLETDFGGLGHKPDSTLTPEQETEILFIVSAWLESLNSADRSRSPIPSLASRPQGRRGMTMSEKIFAAHDIDRRGEVKPGDVVRVDVDWIMASELSWTAMERDYVSLGKPGIFRNDRFWLAGDHVVDPRISNNPQVKKMVASSERAHKDFRMTDYQGMNYTIMHTEFCRERAQPGMLIIGSDSHTCSAGSMGALAAGLGVADVTMPLITGDTWFKIPESVEIRFINSPPVGIGGKDTILYILKELKRNTVASDRVVEYTGPGLQHLSCDARFAIANMTTEFGGISGVFVPDQITYDFIERRKSPRHKKNSNYFRPDPDAEYAVTKIIDLAQVESFVARYPRPDDVVPVSEMADTKLDGCFIGACTTAEEDLILGAMVLEIGLKKGLTPTNHGKRRVVPGSRPILHKLHELGFAAIYEKAGFDIGVPGCSYCVGMGADRASEGEVWISSQNRNFENRMGKGAIGHISSAATVAASSFGMQITDPRPFLDEIDQTRLREALGQRSPEAPTKSPIYVEPGRKDSSASYSEERSSESKEVQSNGTLSSQASYLPLTPPEESTATDIKDVKRGKVQRLGDFIDTDALAPAEILTTCTTNEEFGAHCLKHTHPEFRERAKAGFNIVVAGSAFGCGSSRENAVSALLGTGVQAVIAKSFAFIYGRNQPNLGLLGIIIEDESFYDLATEGKEVEIDVGQCVVKVFKEGSEEEVEGEWEFQLSPMERELINAGGLTSAFRRFGKSLFEVMCTPKGKSATGKSGKGVSLETEDTSCGNTGGLQW